MGAIDCKLCGLPAPNPPILEQCYEFCCHGCAAVFRSFGEDILHAEQPLTETSSPPPEYQGREAFLRIEGLHCTSCEILIKQTAEKIEGIHSVSTSYATSTTKVTYDPERIEKSQLPGIISQSGYKARFPSEKITEVDEGRALLSFILAVGFAGMVMMLNVAFFYPMDLGLVSVEELKPVGWLAFNVIPRVMLLMTTILIFVIGYPILRGAWIGLRTRFLNMDNLLAIAILAAYGFSIGQILTGGLNFYFDVSAVIIAVVTVGRYYEREAKNKATRELAQIIEAWTPSARVRRNGKIMNLGHDEIEPFDCIIIKENESIPADGIIISGYGAIDESLMTGEPFPVVRKPGEKALGGSMVVEGNLEIEVGDVVESQMENLAHILWNVQSSAYGALGIAQRIARIFVPLVLFMALLVTSWMFFSGTHPGYALLAGLATLIVSCPCTFGIAVPLTTANAISTALRHGIIITSADIFERSKIYDTVAIDKTGTLSTGKMKVEQVLGPPEIAEYAAAVERLSSHPIAKAIAALDKQKTATDLIIHPGKGAEAMVEGRKVVVGSKSLFSILEWEVPDSLNRMILNQFYDDGVVSYVGWDGKILGAILTQDQFRPEWKQVIDMLGKNKRVVLLTGAENPSGYEERADEFYAGIPPEAKAAIIRQLKSDGNVIMIGDGNNDAPALSEADMGIAFGKPSSLAADAADVVIPGDRLNSIFVAFDVIKTTRSRIHQNIGWALLYNAIAIPLAITGLLNPLFAALAMASSSILVVWNSSRSVMNKEFQQGLLKGIKHSVDQLPA